MSYESRYSIGITSLDRKRMKVKEMQQRGSLFCMTVSTPYYAMEEDNRRKQPCAEGVMKRRED